MYKRRKGLSQVPDSEVLSSQSDYSLSCYSVLSVSAVSPSFAFLCPYLFYTAALIILLESTANKMSSSLRTHPRQPEYAAHLYTVFLELILVTFSNSILCLSLILTECYS